VPVEPAYEELVARNEVLVAQNEVLRVEVGALRVQVAELVGKVETYRRLADRDSQNSSKPPSTDSAGKRRKAVQARKSAKASKRKPGKQRGAEGKHLARVADPDVIVDHRPECCSGCGAILDGTEPVGQLRRQIFDIPAPRVVVTEHRAHKLACGCGTVTTGSFPAGVNAPTSYGPRVSAVALYLMARQHVPFERTAEAMADMFAVKVSTGWLDSLYSRAAEGLEPFITAVAGQLGDSPVVGVDETSDRVSTDTCWFHVARTDKLTLLHADATRGQDAVERAGVLPGYTGTLVHDRLAMYWNYTDAGHAVCGAHLLRNLAAVGIVWNQTWALAMATLLRDALTATNTARRDGANSLTVDQLADIDTRYRQALDQAFNINPQPGRVGTIAREAHNLAVAFRDRQTEILAFTRNLDIPFTNNGAERDLRMIKLHRKISGCFRNITGAKRLATVRSYIATTQKHGHHTLDTLTALFNGQAWIPPPTQT